MDELIPRLIQWSEPLNSSFYFTYMAHLYVRPVVSSGGNAVQVLSFGFSGNLKRSCRVASSQQLSMFLLVPGPRYTKRSCNAVMLNQTMLALDTQFTSPCGIPTVNVANDTD